MVPTDCKYAKTHEWVKCDGDLAVVGITDHAQDALGDITFVELPKAGDTFDKGAECGVIESVKAASDLYCPVGGEIAEANESLTTAPEIINKEPHGGGWLYKVKYTNASELDELMDAAAYEAFLESEG
jgi:glycine cleavage system H protein